MTICYDQVIDFDKKQYKKIEKLTRGQGEDAGCLLDYNYIENFYRLNAADLTSQNELDANPKVIQQIQLFGQLNNLDDVNADGI